MPNSKNDIIQSDKVERDDTLYLPMPHPLFRNPPEGSIRAIINKVWIGFNFFLRGIYATIVEWCISGMDLVLEYPRVALALLLMGGVIAEETLSDTPMLESTYRYVLYTLNPEAAEKILPDPATKAEAKEVVESLSADLVQKAAKDYYQSPQYKTLEQQVRMMLHGKVVEDVYRIMGLDAELEAFHEAQMKQVRANLEAVLGEPVSHPPVQEDHHEPEPVQHDPEPEQSSPHEAVEPGPVSLLPLTEPQQDGGSTESPSNRTPP